MEAVRPKGKTPQHDLRRTILAIFWRHENGAKWRSIPAELGPWWRAARLFIRWTKLGVWERVFQRAQEQQRIALGMTFLDGTNIRTHDKAATGQKRISFHERDHREALGRSRSGYGKKVYVIDTLPAISAKRRGGPVACPKWAYRCRHLVENLWARLKEWCAVATRYEKIATSFLAVIQTAAAVWIKSLEPVWKVAEV
jgi:transposase